MKLSAENLFLLTHCAVSAAYQAGHLVSEYSELEMDVEKKAGGSSLASQVVTEVDNLSQNLILKTLLPTCNIFDLALLAEESADDMKRKEKDYFWCIDPLDGTLPFIESTPGYAVSIALVSRSGVPQIGVIYDPVEENLYHAVKGCGAFRNGIPWERELSERRSENSYTLICDRSFVEQDRYNDILSELENAAVEGGFSGLEIIYYGGAAMNACWVLEKGFACYFKFPKLQDGGGCLWDYAATAAIFNEIDAVVSDIYGAPLDLNRDRSTFMNHRGVIYATETDMADRIMNIYKKFSTD